MRNQLLQGKLELPGVDIIAEKLSEETALEATQMFQALWYNYLKNKGSVSLVYWSERFTNKNHFNIVLKSLADAGWVVTHSIPARNWAEANLNENKLLQYVTPEELEQIRAKYKFQQYKLDKNIAKFNDKVKLNGKEIKRTGLIREGFRLASNVQYRYDTETLARYRDSIQLNLTKSMDKLAQMYPQMRHDKASYDVVSCEMLDYYINNKDLVFSNGQNYIDSRGRNIQGNLNKIANYISYKDFRASLVIL